MFPMDHQLGPIAVEYDASPTRAQTAGRIVRQFSNAYAARCFYGVKDKQGRRPQVLRSETIMCPQVISEANDETTNTTDAVATPEVKKAPAKKTPAKQPVAKKAPAVKAPVKAEKAKPTAKPTAKATAKAKAKAKPKEKKERTPTEIVAADPANLSENQLKFLKGLKNTVKGQREMSSVEIEKKAGMHPFSTAWKCIKELGEAGLLQTGIKTGRAQTYYITTKGTKVISK